jgi:hypothetical protein
MKLWNSVCVTDPETTTKVNQRGGFTAICAQAQLKKATELWGPYGGKWGVKNLNYFHVQRGSLADAVTITALMYYPGGEIEIASDMPYEPKNDCYKKLLTDVTTKALSKLGFNSDVFEGKFDDSKYVLGLKQAKKRAAKATAAPEVATEEEQQGGGIPDDVVQAIEKHSSQVCSWMENKGWIEFGSEWTTASATNLRRIAKNPAKFLKTVGVEVSK